MNENIKNKAVSGAIWKFLESFLAQFITMVVTIILARILTPDDYASISIITIFFNFCNVLITGGLNTALIQKKDSDDLDFSTVTLATLVMSALIYIIMFFSAPGISSLYNQPILIPMIRIMSITLFINGIHSIAAAKVSSQLNFKTFFFATLSGSIISAIIGITLAKSGAGAWALVAQQMSSGLINTIILIALTKMKISVKFSYSRFKGLFSYGSKIFAASIISIIYDELKPLIVGVKYSGADLAFYNKGRSFPATLNNSICNTLSAVLFPVISKVQTNFDTVLGISRNFMRVSSYIVFPVLLGFVAVSENFVLLFLTEKWLPVVPYIKIFSVSYMFNILQTGNLQTIRAIGRSDIILKLEIIKKVSFFIVIALFVFFTNSPQWLAMSVIVTTLIATVCNFLPNKRLIGYKYRYIISDILPNLLLSVIMMAVVMFVGGLSVNLLLKLVIQVICGAAVYVLLSIIFKNPSFKYVLSMISGLRRKKSA